jgi:glyoxylate reductase
MMDQSRPRVLLTRQLPEAILAPLRAVAEVDVWQEPRQIDRALLLARAAAVDGLMCMLTERVDAELLEHCPALTAVSSMSVGIDHIDQAAATRRGIAIGHTPGVLVETTADLTFALLLGAARRLAEADRYIRGGCWRGDNRWYPDMLLGRDVHGATLGIIGLGAIGQAVARRAAGFNMRVLGWSRSGRDVPGVATVSLDSLLAEADFISVNLALTAATRMLLDRAAFERIKPGAVLVNAARGGIVDEVAMGAALRSGRLFAAGIDVFEREPLDPDSELLALPNVVLTPHIGSATRHAREQMATMAVANMVAALRGEKIPHCANPEVYD